MYKGCLKSSKLYPERIQAELYLLLQHTTAYYKTRKI